MPRCTELNALLGRSSGNRPRILCNARHPRSLVGFNIDPGHFMAQAPTANPPTPYPRSQPPVPGPAAGWRSRLRPVPWWLIFVSLMLTNYVVTSVFFAEPQSVAVPYSVFRAQLQAGNIAELTSTGDSIRG